MNLGERLQEKWGALPVWAWGAIVAAVALLAYFILNRRGNDAGSVVTSARLDPTGYQTSGMTGASNVTTETTIPESNAGWLNRASRLVSTALAQSPTAVYAALQKWLSGQDITEQEKGWVDEAINRAMAPPEGTQGTSAVIPTATTPAPSGKSVKSEKGYYTRLLVRQGKTGVREAVWGNLTWGVQTIYSDGSKMWTPITTQAAANAKAKQIGNFTKLSNAAFDKKASER